MMFIIGLLLFVSSLLAQELKCVLLYYHHKPLPDDVLYAYDWVVLDADNPYMEVLKEKGFLSKKEGKTHRLYERRRDRNLQGLLQRP